MAKHTTIEHAEAAARVTLSTRKRKATINIFKITLASGDVYYKANPFGQDHKILEAGKPGESFQIVKRVDNFS